jgi:hypothetical protein
MSEIAAVAGLLACTGGFIAAGVTFGTRYIDRTLGVADRRSSADQPLVLPSRPSGSNWHLTDAA